MRSLICRANRLTRDLPHDLDVYTDPERDHLRYYLRQGLDPDDYPRPHEQDRDADSKTVVGKGETTFGILADQYRRQRRTEDLRDSTLRTENRTLRKWILPEIESWVVQRVAPRDFEELRLQWHDRFIATEQKSPATVNKWLRILKHFVGWCCRRAGVLHAARDLKSLPKPKKKRGTALSRQEVDSLLNAVRERFPHYYALVYLAAYTGQRWGTLTALEWRDIDEPNGLLHFRRSQKYGEVSHGSKTGHVHSVPLKRFSATLDFHKDVMQKWAPLAFKKSELVFPAQGDPDKLKYGGYRTESGTVNRALKICCKDRGIRRVSFHDLRRTFVTIALDEGVSPTSIKAFTGHSDAMIGHYHHQSQASKDEVIGVVMGENGTKEKAKKG